MEPEFKVGQMVVIIANNAFHGFSIGEVVEITHLAGCGGYLCKSLSGREIACNFVSSKDIAAVLEVPTSDIRGSTPTAAVVDEAASVEACAILEDAAAVLRERGKSRDQSSGERSMARTVRIFNSMTDIGLTEEQGWKFMLALKLARMAGGKFHFDDFIDTVGYSALLAECAGKEALAA